jgi:tripartite-type tricarboxylate transporter receptor subunit TctC
MNGPSVQQFVLLVRLIACGVMMLAPTAAAAQTYPTRPIRLVTSEAGGGNDIQARLIGQGLSIRLGQRIVVDNRPSGVIPGEIVSKSAPDGYTLLLYNNTLWIGTLMQKTPYDAAKDFSAVTWVSSTPNVLVVHSALPVQSLAELIALARAKPGELNYASSGTGASNHLAGELFKSMTGVNIVRIAYKGAAQGLNDLIGGRVQLMFPTSVSVTPFLKSGQVRALAVTSAAPSALAPGLPTMAAAGLPGYESISIYGVFAPSGTPRPVVEKLNAEIVRVLSAPELKDRFFNIGTEPVGGSPDQLAATIRSEMLRMARVIKDAGIRSE